MSKAINKIDVYRRYVLDEMAKKAKRGIHDLEEYVDSLDKDKLKKICRSCSHSRKNGVYKFISQGPGTWKIETIDISDIFVRGINSKVNGHLSKNKWSLQKISKDKKIPKLREFKRKGKIHPKISILIAHKKGKHRYKLIDGNHRAIKLACHGVKEFKLIFYER